MATFVEWLKTSQHTDPGVQKLAEADPGGQSAAAKAPSVTAATDKQRYKSET